MLIFDALSLDAEKTLSTGTPRALIICHATLFGVQQTLLMMRSNKVHGGSMETRIMSLLRHGNPCAAVDIAESLDADISDVWEVLERMFWSSKLEKRNGKMPFYRIPGKQTPTLSLPN